MDKRKAVAPVIATLLLVAIAVVGGSILFIVSQGFFSSEQINPNEEPKHIEPPTPRELCDRMAQPGDDYACVQRNKIIENQERIIELLKERNEK